MISLISIITLCYLAVGSIGMAVGNRGHSVSEKRARWLKFFMYVLITIVMLTSIYFRVLYLTGGVIVLAGYYELLKTKPLKFAFLINALILFSLLATGFLVFCIKMSLPWQLFIYFQVFTFDAFSQIIGQVYGERKLIPSVSPGKTVEGFLGGTIFCCLSSVLAIDWLGISFLQGMGVGLLTSVTALSGDLLASFYKRKIGIKDYSELLPGQGGFLDRFDSLIFTGAIYAVLWG